MAVRESRRSHLGEPVKLYWNALPAQQRKVLRACAGPTHRWKAYLAGGTALALYLGHRRSEDLDWFTPETLDPGQLLADVKAMGFPLKLVQNDTGTFLAIVGGVKFSVFRYRYPFIEPFVETKGVNLASLRDMAAMKLAALMARATKRD
jgi:Nucleotidyl transferase AbiEii toxin, Type IV TA system